MLKKWTVLFDGDRIYSVRCSGPLFGDEEEEFPIYTSIPEGDMVTMLLAYNIDEALKLANDIIENEEWKEDGNED